MERLPATSWGQDGGGGGDDDDEDEDEDEDKDTCGKARYRSASKHAARVVEEGLRC